MDTGSLGHPSRWMHFIVAVLVFTVSCSDGELRGNSVTSPDGKTYLVVDEVWGSCDTIWVDGQKWPAVTHAPHPISPGPHVISCGKGGEIEFEIRAGTTFHFDYWGP